MELVALHELNTTKFNYLTIFSVPSHFFSPTTISVITATGHNHMKKKIRMLKAKAMHSHTVSVAVILHDGIYGLMLNRACVTHHVESSNVMICKYNFLKPLLSEAEVRLC